MRDTATLCQLNGKNLIVSVLGGVLAQQSMPTLGELLNEAQVAM